MSDYPVSVQSSLENTRIAESALFRANFLSIQAHCFCTEHAFFTAATIGYACSLTHTRPGRAIKRIGNMDNNHWTG